jgi:hypothetical protein
MHYTIGGKSKAKDVQLLWVVQKIPGRTVAIAGMGGVGGFHLIWTAWKWPSNRHACIRWAQPSFSRYRDALKSATLALDSNCRKILSQSRKARSALPNLRRSRELVALNGLLGGVFSSSGLNAPEGEVQKDALC